MKPRNDLTGRRFGRLVVVRQDGADCDCICDCGKSITVKSYNLTNGRIKSCGCLKRSAAVKAHGAANAKKYFHRDGTALNAVSGPTKASKTGVRGVYALPTGKFEARLMFRGEFVLMKHFDTFAEAVKARQDAENEYLKPLKDEWEPAPAELAEKQLVTAEQAAKIISLRCGVNYTRNAVVGLIKAGRIAGTQEIKNTLCVPAQWATSYLPLKSRTRKGVAKK